MDTFVEKALSELYGTSDFSIASYMIVSGAAELDNIVPLLREMDSPIKPLRFQFRLRPINGKTLTDLKRCEFDFINQSTRVEPVAYQSVRRRLHERITRLTSEITEVRNNGK